MGSSQSTENVIKARCDGATLQSQQPTEELRQEEHHQFKGTLDYTVGPYLENQSIK